MNLRNSKRRLKIECLRYCSNFCYQNSLMLCWCMKLLGKIRGIQFSKGFTSSWTAATCFSMLFLIENWKSQILLKFGYQNSFMLSSCVKLLGKIRDFEILSFFLNFALRNSKRTLKIECLKYCLKFGYQNSLMLCSCVKLLGKIRDNQF